MSTERPSWWHRCITWLDASLGSWALADMPCERFALARIGLGLTMLAAYLHLAPDLEFIYGDTGLIAALRPDRTGLARSHTELLWLLAVVSSASFALGRWTKISACLLVWAHFQFYSMTRVHSWGWTTIAPAFVLYVAFAGAGRVHALGRPRRVSGEDLQPQGRACFWRLTQTHVAAIYFTAAWSRLFSPGWHHGDMVLVALENSLFSRFSGVDWLPLQTPLMWACWLAWLLELVAPR